jgi:hypothetical protein
MNAGTFHLLFILSWVLAIACPPLLVPFAIGAVVIACVRRKRHRYHY